VPIRQRAFLVCSITEEQKGLCEAIGGLARQAMRSAEIRAVQDQIDALVNVLYKTSD